jgi:hypothetical protein
VAVAAKHIIGLVQRGAVQEVALQLVAAHGGARRSEQAGTATAEELLRCVDIDRRAV